MFVKLNENNVPSEWPVGAEKIKQANPRISFPARMTDVDVSLYGFCEFKTSTPPNHDARYQKIIENTPELVNGVYVQQWVVKELYTAEEKTARIKDDDDAILAEMASSYREERSIKLTQSDWTQIADAPVDSSVWTAYRQALRDLPSHSNWPNLESGDWPTEP